MLEENRILLILDLDETLIHASERPLQREPDFTVEPYSVYQRPGLSDFLEFCHGTFQVAIWSSSGADYLRAVVPHIIPSDHSLAFVWDRSRCVQRYDSERMEPYFVKDLKKVKRIGFDLNRVLIVDDTSQKVERNFGNAIYISPYYGDPADDDLKRLNPFLKSLTGAANVRTIEKRGWRNASKAGAQ